jgi:hypothetical protein
VSVLCSILGRRSWKYLHTLLTSESLWTSVKSTRWRQVIRDT